VLPEARPACGEVCEESASGGVGRGVQVGLRDADPQRGAVAVAMRCERSARGPEHELAVGVTRLRAVAAERRDRRVDDARIRALHVRVGEAAARHRAGRLGLEHEIGLRAEPDASARLAGLEVARHAALVRRVRLPVERIASFENGPTRRALDPPAARPGSRRRRGLRAGAGEQAAFVREVDDPVRVEKPITPRRRPRRAPRSSSRPPATG
jgi:hypothetical protein